MTRPAPDPVGPGQESVWDYPRPGSVRHCDRAIRVVLGDETICETCSFFVPTIVFRDQIQAQHQDAIGHGDEQRQKIYANLLKQLEQGA